MSIETTRSVAGAIVRILSSQGTKNSIDSREVLERLKENGTELDSGNLARSLIHLSMKGCVAVMDTPTFENEHGKLIYDIDVDCLQRF